MRVLVGSGWYYLAAQVCATLLVLLWNYFGNRLWTFGAARA
jgi:putative flippase GtrA